MAGIGARKVPELEFLDESVLSRLHDPLIIWGYRVSCGGQQGRPWPMNALQ